MPTGVALRDARARLFAAAERVLMRDGARGLTSRAVTEEAGVAKGVLHRHFADFDDFLAELVRDRIARFGAETDELTGAAGSATLVSNLAEALTRIFTPVNLGLVGIVIARDDLRSRLRARRAFQVSTALGRSGGSSPGPGWSTIEAFTIGG